MGGQERAFAISPASETPPGPIRSRAEPASAGESRPGAGAPATLETPIDTDANEGFRSRRGGVAQANLQRTSTGYRQGTVCGRGDRSGAVVSGGGRWEPWGDFDGACGGAGADPEDQAAVSGVHCDLWIGCRCPQGFCRAKGVGAGGMVAYRTCCRPSAWVIVGGLTVWVQATIPVPAASTATDGVTLCRRHALSVGRVVGEH
jgi:hypothetical protein